MTENFILEFQQSLMQWLSFNIKISGNDLNTVLEETDSRLENEVTKNTLSNPAGLDLATAEKYFGLMGVRLSTTEYPDVDLANQVRKPIEKYLEEKRAEADSRGEIYNTKSLDREIEVSEGTTKKLLGACVSQGDLKYITLAELARYADKIGFTLAESRTWRWMLPKSFYEKFFNVDGPPNTTLGEFLKDTRKYIASQLGINKYTQAMLSHDTGFSIPTISQLENNHPLSTGPVWRKLPPSEDLLKRFAVALGIKYELLDKLKDNTNYEPN